LYGHIAPPGLAAFFYLPSRRDQKIHNTILEVSVKYLRIKQVQQIVPVSKSTIYEWIKQGKFPAPTKLGERTSAWNEDAVIEFCQKAA
jgi:prophage regulatory protein